MTTDLPSDQLASFVVLADGLLEREGDLLLKEPVFELLDGPAQRAILEDYRRQCAHTPMIRLFMKRRARK